MRKTYQIAVPLFLCSLMVLLMVGMATVANANQNGIIKADSAVGDARHDEIAQPLSVSHMRMATNTLLFSDTFDYPDGTVIDHVATDLWYGQHEPPDVSAVAQAGQAHLNGRRSLTTVGTFLNERDTYTHIEIDLIGESTFSYRMDVDTPLGISVSFDGNDRVKVRSNNLRQVRRANTQTFVVAARLNKVHVDLYLKDQESQVFISDDLGMQATPLWHNEDIFGNIEYRLRLGDGGIYDNVQIRYTDGPLPTPDSPRAPLFVTEDLVEGVINEPYILQLQDESLVEAQQIRADGGQWPLDYAITDGALPTGITFTTVYTNPTDDGSPLHWVGVFSGTPTITGTFPITVQVSDALSRTAMSAYTMTILSPYPPAIEFTEHFTGTDGEVIHDVPGSQWTGRYGGDEVSATYQNNRAQILRAHGLTALESFRNADSRYLHAGVRVFHEADNNRDGGTIKLTCGEQNWGVLASYDGDSTVEVKSNRLGNPSNMFTDTFTVTAGLEGEIGLDLYLKGAESRVYVSDANGVQVTEVYYNERLEGTCENADYTLSLGYAGLYDDVVVEDLSEMPELYNPVGVVNQALLIGFEGVPYSDQLTATGGKEPYTWTVAAPPSGLALSPDGLLSGVPSVPGDYELEFTVTDDIGQVATWSFTMTVEADPAGNLLFADRFSMPNDLRLVERDAAHWTTSARTNRALTYQDGWMEVLAHRHGELRPSFANDGVTPLQFSWRMNKGRVRVAQVNTCWGMEMEYDGIQHITVRWNDMCWQRYMKQQDFLLSTLDEIITVSIELRGQQFALRIEDSQEIYQRGPFETWRLQVGEPVSIHFRDNTPYGEGRYTSYQSGPSQFDDLTVRRVAGCEILGQCLGVGSTLREQEELGRLLFFDPILSGDNRRACASCHQFDKGFADGLAKEIGMNGQLLARNSPGITNIALMGAHFWEGREPDLDQVGLHPIQNSAEMGQALPELITELQAIPEYEEAFSAIWSDGVTAEHIGEALAAYSRTLMELRTNYDWSLYRQETLTAEEDAGLILFEGKAGCAQCHSLVPVTQVGDTTYSDPIFKTLGVPADAAGTQLDGDIGREAVTGNAEDRHAFRVPNLRNLSRTAPYMHNGVFETLEEVVDFYNEGGGTGIGLTVPNQADEIQPLGLTDTEKQQLLTFLAALSPKYPNYVEIPDNLPSGLPVGGTDPILTPTSAGIRGQVSASNGTPLAGILVDAYQLGFNNTWTPAGSTHSTTTGHYTVTDLGPGTFRVYFLDPSGDYADEYYDDAGDFGSATALTVVTSSMTSDIDAMLALRTPAAAQVAGSAAVWDDPHTGEVTVSAWDGSEFTLTREATCPQGATPTEMTLLIGADLFPMSETSPGSGQYSVTLRVPDDLSNGGTQQLALRQICPSRASTPSGSTSLTDEPIGTLFIQLEEPMGQITDANTGQPIAGASVTLYKVPDWQAQVDPEDLEDNTCESNHSRLPGSAWNQPAPTDIGVRVDPTDISAAEEISPSINPLITGADGHYAWQVADGCWYVVVQAEGYETEISSLVGTSPAVTDLHVVLQPITRLITSSSVNIQSGWNHITLPLEPDVAYTAEGLCDEIESQGGSVAEIDRWHNGGWDGHICGLSFNNFDLEMGTSYFIKGNAPSTWTTQGYIIEEALPLTLQQGWNSISIPHTDAYTAESLCDDLIAQGINVVEIDRWHNGGWQGHICGLPFNDFTIDRRTGYFIKSNSSGTITPSESASSQ